MHEAIFVWDLKSNHITPERSNQMTKEKIVCLYPSVHVKDLVLGNVFWETSLDSFWQNLWLHPPYQDILQLTSGKIWDFLSSCWGCLLTLWLKTLYPTINLAFLRIIVELNFLRNIAHTVLYDFVSKEVTQYIFFSLVQGLIVIIAYYFQIRNKKQHIIISRVISNHIGSMYIEKPFNFHLFW